MGGCQSTTTKMETIASITAIMSSPRQQGSPSYVALEHTPDDVCRKVATDLFYMATSNCVEGRKSTVNVDIFKRRVPTTIGEIQFFLTHISNRTSLGGEALMHSLMLLKKVCSSDDGPGVVVLPETMALLIFTSIVLWEKYACDESYSNMHYARFCQIPLSLMNKLESAFLEFLDYNFSIDSIRYASCVRAYNDPEFFTKQIMAL